LSGSAVVVRYGGHEFPVDSALDFGPQVAVIAERLQDDVIDDEHQGWPMSGDGRRLLSARVHPEDGAAWWYDEETPVAPVGRERSQDQR
jgi:GGDEF domain-containing protein